MVSTPTPLFFPYHQRSFILHTQAGLECTGGSEELSALTHAHRVVDFNSQALRIGIIRLRH